MILNALTNRVSHPPTMLRPRPTFPLQISMVVSLPATTGQLRGSGAAGQSGRSVVREACAALRGEGEVTGGASEAAGERALEPESGAGRDEE